MHPRSALIPAVALVAAIAGTNARAHHEAIFGPQSSLVLSAPAFVSLQAFSRRTGQRGSRTQETTALLSAGATPFQKVPLSFSLIAPMSRISELDAGTELTGIEDILVGARYRFDFEGLQRAFDREGNYGLLMASVEFPTGTVDHPAFRGPVDGMFAALGGLEWSAFSTIAYAFFRANGPDALGDRSGDSLFLGSGLAWTPFDDPVHERLVSLQLGLSHETYLPDVASGRSVERSGGWGLLAHPTVVWGPGGHVLLFAMTSFPIAQAYADPAQQDRWRVGLGAILLLGQPAPGS